MIPLRCHKCGHVWPYGGKSLYRTTCPHCGITVYLDKCEVDEDEYIKILQQRHAAELEEVRSS